MTVYNRYRTLLHKLALVRARAPGGDSPEADALLDTMDEVWDALSDGERAAMERERDRLAVSVATRAVPA
ncbi:hypothetical protein D7X30_37860 [Corallococcus sp. AB011P]|uniref:hypothetical protein n=1 Tax=unclassified Corallococcus TaxID=2685029 RepID=UPI000EA04C45|nr:MULTISPECIES: hypothetical protein [unclassified Corallococcus]RKG50226.1 hypothetical protein D7X30_37860 [Corallococcus sp. AB011P]RKH90770.1 hypothetical protein D7Y21_05130 [Corallococcus sp. AB045]